MKSRESRYSNPWNPFVIIRRTKRFNYFVYFVLFRSIIEKFFPYSDFFSGRKQGFPWKWVSLSLVIRSVPVDE